MAQGMFNAIIRTEVRPENEHTLRTILFKGLESHISGLQTIDGGIGFRFSLSPCLVEVMNDKCRMLKYAVFQPYFPDGREINMDVLK